MKKYLLLIGVLFPLMLFSQEKTDTIPHINGNCIGNVAYHNEKINFSFIEDEIIISGKISANCGGNHFLVVKTNNNEYQINKLDTGMLEDCRCIFDFSLTIPHCTLSLYQIHFNECGIDTTLQKKSTNIDIVSNEEIKCFPNPSNKNIQISIPNYQNTVSQLVIYSISGKKVLERNDIQSNIVQVRKEEIGTGIFICIIKSNNKTVKYKLIID